MKQTAVEFLEEMMTIALGEHHMTLFINEFNKAKKIEEEQKHESINVQVDILRDTLDEMMAGFDSEEDRMNFILDICNGYKKRIKSEESS
jgi:uncharacterized protein (UPF0305 family)